MLISGFINGMDFETHQFEMDQVQVMLPVSTSKKVDDEYDESIPIQFRFKTSLVEPKSVPIFQPEIHGPNRLKHEVINSKEVGTCPSLGSTQATSIDHLTIDDLAVWFPLESISGHPIVAGEVPGRGEPGSATWGLQQNCSSNWFFWVWKM